MKRPRRSNPELPKPTLPLPVLKNPTLLSPVLPNPMLPVPVLPNRSVTASAAAAGLTASRLFSLTDRPVPLSRLLITGLFNRLPRFPELSRPLTEGLLSRVLTTGLLSRLLTAGLLSRVLTDGPLSKDVTAELLTKATVIEGSFNWLMNASELTHAVNAGEFDRLVSTVCRPPWDSTKFVIWFSEKLPHGVDSVDAAALPVPPTPNWVNKLLKLDPLLRCTLLSRLLIEGLLKMPLSAGLLNRLPTDGLLSRLVTTGLLSRPVTDGPLNRLVTTGLLTKAVIEESFSWLMNASELTHEVNADERDRLLNTACNPPWDSTKFAIWFTEKLPHGVDNVDAAALPVPPTPN
nr:hypothetical protein [Mycobacterium bourgelatii]